jgi:hypothetical protein
VNGKDFWMGKASARIVNTTIVKCGVRDQMAFIVSKNSWLFEEQTICTDTTLIQCGVIEGGRFIDYKITIFAKDADVIFGDTKEGAMAIRTHPALRLQGAVATGSSINSEGITGVEVWGKAAKWIDYWGTIEGKIVGIAVFDHPKNPRHPTTWHARDYGLIAANPFAKKHFKAGEGPLTIAHGQSVTFAYRFFFHQGNPETATIAKHYEAWTSAYQYERED